MSLTALRSSIIIIVGLFILHSSLIPGIFLAPLEPSAACFLYFKIMAF